VIIFSKQADSPLSLTALPFFMKRARMRKRQTEENFPK